MRIGGGRAGGRRLRRPGSSVRPTTSRVRAALFSILGPGSLEGKRVLDLYAGTGAFGLEALSRGAARADFVEINARRCSALRRALGELGFAESGRVYQANAARVSGRLEGGYHVVFVDPPYRSNPFAAVFGGLVRDGRLAEGAVVFAEHDRRTQLEDEYPGLRLADRRVYGDTAVSVFRVGGDGPE